MVVKLSHIRKAKTHRALNLLHRRLDPKEKGFKQKLKLIEIKKKKVKN